MKKRIALIVCSIVLALNTYTLKAQNYCGFNEILQQNANNNPSFNSQYQGVMNSISNYLKSQNYPNLTNPITNNALFVIPVVVHIIDPTNANIIPYNQVEAQIDALNAAFANTYVTPGPNAVNTQIQFCLARNTSLATISWTGGNSQPGVMRYTSPFANTTNNSQGMQDLISVTHNIPGAFPFTQYLNIWVVNSINDPLGANGYCGPIFGYGTYPWFNTLPLDGVVIDRRVFGGQSSGSPFNTYPNCTSCVNNNSMNFSEGKVLVHEIGHYLGLLHPFDPAINTSSSVCVGLNPTTALTDQCDLYGDLCCDVPPCHFPSVLYTGGPIPNTCALGPDPVENFMYYSDNTFMNTFTNNQRQIMHFHLLNSISRNNLSSLNNQIFTGIVGPNGCQTTSLFPQFTHTSTYCVNANVNFATIPSPPNPTGVTFNWTFQNGNPSTSNNPNPIVQWNTAGTYTVTCTASDGITTASHTDYVTINNCSLNSAYLRNANWFFGRFAAINFTATGPVLSNVAATNQTVFGDEGATAISDNLGNLLFYTDKVRIWNNLHVLNTNFASTLNIINTNPALPQFLPTNDLYGLTNSTSS